MNLIGIALARLASERKIEWFQEKHARIIETLMRFERMFYSEIILLVNEDKKKTGKAILELERKCIIGFDGERYFLEEPLEKMLELIEEAEAEKASVRVKSKR